MPITDTIRNRRTPRTAITLAIAEAYNRGRTDGLHHYNPTTADSITDLVNATLEALDGHTTRTTTATALRAFAAINDYLNGIDRTVVPAAEWWQALGILAALEDAGIILA